MQLVADIGGTNTRLALVEHGQPVPDTLLSVRNAGFDDFYAVLRHYLAETGGAPPSALCVAIAGPVKGNAGELTNLAWHLETDRLAQVAGADRAVLMNDLAALAHAMPHFTPEQTQTLRAAGPSARRNGQSFVLGLGTGVNLAVSLALGQGRFRVMEAEAGHIALPAPLRRSLELALGRDAAEGFETLECLFAGGGLRRLHACLSGGQEMSGHQIIASPDPAAQDTVILFARLLGQALRDLILLYLPLDGVYLAGGAGRGVLSVAQAAFLQALAQPHRMADILAAPQISVILDDAAALQGCAARLNMA